MKDLAFSAKDCPWGGEDGGGVGSSDFSVVDIEVEGGEVEVGVWVEIGEEVEDWEVVVETDLFMLAEMESGSDFVEDVGLESELELVEVKVEVEVDFAAGRMGAGLRFNFVLFILFLLLFGLKWLPSLFWVFVEFVDWLCWKDRVQVERQCRWRLLLDWFEIILEWLLLMAIGVKVKVDRRWNWSLFLEIAIILRLKKKKRGERQQKI